jgi:ribosomal protein S12 methylthiotransferase
VTEELVSLMASTSSIVPYLDIPIQHIHRSILREMGRRGNGERLRELIASLRHRIPGMVLRTTLMVGFPGETEEAFRDLFDFVEETRFDHLGVFAYSPEEGTPAAGYPGQISDGTKAERKDAILRLQSRISREINRRRIGTTLQVLVEGASPETDLLLAGRYYGQAPEVDGLVLINKGHAVTGAFSNVRITDAHTYDLVGEILE